MVHVWESLKLHCLCRAILTLSNLGDKMSKILVLPDDDFDGLWRNTKYQIL